MCAAVQTQLSMNNSACSEAHIVNLKNFVLLFPLMLSPQQGFCGGIRVLG